MFNMHEPHIYIIHNRKICWPQILTKVASWTALLSGAAFIYMV